MEPTLLPEGVDPAEFTASLLPRIQTWATGAVDAVIQPWTLYQLGIILVLFGISWVISNRVEPRLESWVRSLKINPGFLRVLAALLRRVEWIIFVPLVWIAWSIANDITWPWNTFLLKLAGNLSIAWLVISVLSRIIRSRPVARLVAWSAWLIVALNLTGYLPDALSTLDAIAFSVGEIRISLLLVLKGAALLVSLIWLATNLGNYAETRLRNFTDLTPSLQVLIGKIVKILLVIIAIIVALNSIGVDLTALTIFSGAIGVGLGFGLQKVVSNFISGVIILLDKSIKPGDTISIEDTFGWIRELRSRFVSVVTRDGREFLIPNEDFITEKVVNWSFTDKLVRLDVPFGVAYDSDPHEVTRLSIAATETVERVSGVKKPVCWMTEFGDSSLNFMVRFWISDPQNGLTNIRGKVLLALWDTFKEHEIGIPFPHREIIMRTPVEVKTSMGDVRD